MSDSRQVSPSVSVWPWRAGGERVLEQKAGMNVRLKAILQATAMSAFGALLFFRFHHRIGPFVIWSMAALVACGGLFYPPLFHGIERFGQKLGGWVAKGLTYALLVPFYFLVFVPTRLVMALGGSDPMCRTFPGKETTYWVTRKKVDAAQYKKQH